MGRINFSELKPRQWIVITGEINQEEEKWTEGDMFRYKPPKWKPDGQPLEVLSVDLPFILLKHLSGAVSALDIRCYAVQRAKKQYVQACIREYEDRAMNPERERRVSMGLEEPKRRRRKIKTKKDPRDCPRCNTRIREVRVSEGLWRKVCPNCGYDGGSVDTPKGE